MFHWHLMKFDETCLSVSDMREALYEKWETSYLERDGALAENFKNVSKITTVRYDVIISRDENRRFWTKIRDSAALFLFENRRFFGRK